MTTATPATAAAAVPEHLSNSESEHDRRDRAHAKLTMGSTGAATGAAAAVVPPNDGNGSVSMAHVAKHAAHAGIMTKLSTPPPSLMGGEYTGSFATHKQQLAGVALVEMKKGGNLRAGAPAERQQQQRQQYVESNSDEDEVMDFLDAEEAELEAAALRVRSQQPDLSLDSQGQQRRLEDVDYWRKRAGWYDDDVSMQNYNQGVYDTYYSLDDAYIPASEGSGGSSGGGGAMAAHAVKAILGLLGIVVVFFVGKSILKRMKSKSSDSDRSASHKGRSSSRSKRDGGESESKSRSSHSKRRSRSKSASRSSRTRSRSRSHRSKGRGREGDYELMDEEEGTRKSSRSKSSRSKSRSRSSRSKSRSRSSKARESENMLV